MSQEDLFLESHNLGISKYKKVNALLVNLYLFQYGLLLSLSGYFESKILIIVFTLLILLYILFSGRIQVTRNLVLLFLLPLCMIIFKMPFEYPIFHDGINISKDILLSFLTIGISGIIIGSLYFNSSDFIEQGYKVAWLNFVLIAYLPFTKYYSVTNIVNYMSFGYAMLPTVLFSFMVFVAGRHKRASITLFVFSFLEMLIFGARGALFTLLVFCLFYFLFVSKMSYHKKVLVTFLAVILIFLLPKILLVLIDVLNQYSISSYSISKFSRLLEQESLQEISSGRDALYMAAYDRILQHPIFGSPFNACYVDTGMDYYHNIILDIIVTYGIVFFLVLSVAFFVKLFSLFKFEDINTKLVLLFIVSVPLGRLLLSSNFWGRPEFWVMLSVLVNFRTHPKRV